MIELIHKKHARLLFIALCALIASANLYAFNFEKDGIYYNINSDKTSASATSSSYKHTGNITNTVVNNKNTYNVSIIENNTFSSCLELTSITIPSSVTTIGDHAFSCCSGLTSINIPNSVTTIGNYVFSGCSGLMSITIPSSVTTIGNYAFSDCSGLTNINVDNNNSKYASENGILYNKEKTTLIQAPQGIIGPVTIPNSVTTIRENAFKSCSRLTSITIPNSVTTIGNYAFYGCSGLTSINVENNSSQYASENGILYNKEKTTLIQAPQGIIGPVGEINIQHKIIHKQ